MLNLLYYFIPTVTTKNQILYKIYLNIIDIEMFRETLIFTCVQSFVKELSISMFNG